MLTATAKIQKPPPPCAESQARLRCEADAEAPQTPAPLPGGQGETQMRTRSRDCAEQQARHHADPANDVAAEKSRSKRDPESKQFRDRRNVSVGIIQAFEQREGHGA